MFNSLESEFGISVRIRMVQSMVIEQIRSMFMYQRAAVNGYALGISMKLNESASLTRLDRQTKNG